MPMLSTLNKEAGERKSERKIVNTFWNVIDFIIMCSKINLYEFFYFLLFMNWNKKNTISCHLTFFGYRKFCRSIILMSLKVITKVLENVSHKLSIFNFFSTSLMPKKGKFWTRTEHFQHVCGSVILRNKYNYKLKLYMNNLVNASKNGRVGWGWGLGSVHFTLCNLIIFLLLFWLLFGCFCCSVSIVLLWKL